MALVLIEAYKDEGIFMLLHFNVKDKNALSVNRRKTACRFMTNWLRVD